MDTGGGADVVTGLRAGICVGARVLCEMGVQVGMVKLGCSKGGQVGVLCEFHVFHPHHVKVNLVGEVCGEV
jgi:hypothetical protein